VENVFLIRKNNLYLHRVVHGIRFKVNKWSLGCRETTFSFLGHYLSLAVLKKSRKHSFFVNNSLFFSLAMKKSLYLHPEN
jgi:hypothetical protein